ncbi:error-prone DNA polymerase [bacterium]|nr:error-prone DNA polymerase [bacterium]
MFRYAELHCHSGFSFLDGASNPEELVGRAKDLGLAALAITDHDDLGGIPRFAHAARELSLPGIIGAELTLEDDSHLIVLVQDLLGYRNLCALITLARLERERGSPRLSYEQLFARASGLTALSGCHHGAIPAALARDDTMAARRLLKRFVEVFGSDFYLEVGNHFITQEALIVRQIIEMASSTGVNWVVTNNVHYATSDKRIVHDVLTCLRHKVALSNAGTRLRPNGSWYMKSPEEMTHLWRDNLVGIKNTLAISERCQFRLGWLEPPLPSFTCNEEVAKYCGISPYSSASSESLDKTSDIVQIESAGQLLPTKMSYPALLEQLVWSGAAKRYVDITEQHRKQLNHELSLINKLKLAPYFLIMWDIVRYARSNGIAVQGRGSAANSAVCYCLMITAVDPIGMDLLFERFLSEGRHEPPDIDLDIAHQERERVLQYVYEKYGRAHAAMVCEVITYRGRSATRDAARVLGFSQEQADLLSREANHSEAYDAAARLANGGLERLGFDINDHRVKMLIKVIAGLHQLPRHRSIHVGGFVLSGQPIGEIVPVESAAMEKRTVIQWDKDDIDLVGLIKIDLLGLGMLTMIQEGLKLVSQHRGLDIDIGRLDMNDEKIYQMLQKADTVGVFQVESRAQMNILPKLKPVCFYDIIVSIAIVRPGPIQGNIIHPYLRRRRGEEEVIYLHPSLEPILKRTLGVPLFQEQGMKLAVTAAGFTASQADQLRKVMSHKRSKEKMAKLCGELSAGMKKNGFSETAIETITHQLQAFANYGFPESHAASFSLLVYASAYLKRYYPVEFCCAILNAQPMGFYSPASLIRDAVRHGVEVRPVDLAHSLWHCTLEPLEPLETLEPSTNTLGFAVRLGLRFVDGLGPASQAALAIALQDEKGLFKSVEDVVSRSGLSPSDLKMLAKAGAFESLCPGRRQALWRVLSLLRPQRSMPLLEALIANASANNNNEIDCLYEMPVVLPSMTELEEVLADYRTMNLSTNKHPLSFYRDWAKSRGIHSCLALYNQEDGDDAIVAGGIICRQRPETAKGFVFLTLEDETGMANVIIKPKLFEIYRELVVTGSLIQVHGLLQLDQGVCNVIARHFELLPPLPQLPQLIDRVYLPARNFH